MASINGLPPSVIPNSSKIRKKESVKKSKDKPTSGKTTLVASAVSHSIRHISEAEYNQAQVEYDLPEGRSRRALEQYMRVMNQVKKEKLAQLLGVDMYI